MVLFSAVGWSGFGMLGNAGAQFAGFLYLFHGVGQVVPQTKILWRELCQNTAPSSPAQVMA